MASTFPTTNDSFATNRADATAMATTHKDDHNNANDAINKIEAFCVPSLNTQTVDYTLVIGDASKVVGINAATGKTLTIPTNASVAFPVGLSILIRQAGAGQVTVSPAGGVTLNARGSAFKLAGQYASAVLLKVASDTWEMSGDVTA